MASKIKALPMRAREGCSNVSVNFFFEGRDTIDRVVQNWGESPLSLLTQPLAFRFIRHSPTEKCGVRSLSWSKRLTYRQPREAAQH